MGGQADLKVGWCRWEDRLTSRWVGVDGRTGRPGGGLV